MERYGIPLTAPASETARIENITHAVAEGDEITIAGYTAHVYATPGHTNGHVIFHLPDCFGDHGLGLLGDTLFALGCGRVFEGSMAEMWSSMLKIKALPDNTVLACGHEYSAANARYVESLGWARDGLTGASLRSTPCGPRTNRPCRRAWPMNVSPIRSSTVMRRTSPLSSGLMPATLLPSLRRCGRARIISRASCRAVPTADAVSRYLKAGRQQTGSCHRPLAFVFRQPDR